MSNETQSTWVFCCGMKRSGSTLHYNLTAELVERCGAGKRVGPAQYGRFETLFLNFDGEPGYLVTKAHRFVPQAVPLYLQGRARIVFVWRDVRDVIVSLMDAWQESFFDIVFKRKSVQDVLSAFARWAAFPNALVTRYEDLVADYEREIRRIAEYLGLEPDDDLVREIAEQYDIQRIRQRIETFDFEKEGVKAEAKGPYDPRTLLYTWHVKSGKPKRWKERLTPLQVAIVERLAYRWLKEQGLEITSSRFMRFVAAIVSIVSFAAVRVRRFLRKSWIEKADTIRRKWRSLLSRKPFAGRAPIVGWHLGGYVWPRDEFDIAEQRFLERLVRPGMKVIVVGERSGFFTFWASNKVGPEGTVVTFPLTPREKHILQWGARWFRHRNVRVEPYVLSDWTGTGTLVVEGKGGFVMLSPDSEVAFQLGQTFQVPVMRLDDYLAAHPMEDIDLVFLRMQGADLHVLQGAKDLLTRVSRPVVVCEVRDAYTRLWGYPAQEIVDFLRQHGYIWFRPIRDGAILMKEGLPDGYDDLLIAWPEEKLLAEDVIPELLFTVLMQKDLASVRA